MWIVAAPQVVAANCYEHTKIVSQCIVYRLPTNRGSGDRGDRPLDPMERPGVVVDSANGRDCNAIAVMQTEFVAPPNTETCARLHAKMNRDVDQVDRCAAPRQLLIVDLFDRLADQLSRA